MADVKPTADIIAQMAITLKRYSEDLERCAERMVETGDWHYASEAAQTVTNCFANLRLDLLVTRPIRELTRDRND